MLTKRYYMTQTTCRRCSKEVAMLVEVEPLGEIEDNSNCVNTYSHCLSCGNKYGNTCDIDKIISALTTEDHERKGVVPKYTQPFEYAGDRLPE